MAKTRRGLAALLAMIVWQSPPAAAHSPSSMYATTRPAIGGQNGRNWWFTPSMPAEWTMVVHRAAETWNRASANFKFNYAGLSGPYSPWGNCSYDASDPWDRGKTNGVHYEALPNSEVKYVGVVLFCNVNTSRPIVEHTSQEVRPFDEIKSFNIVFEPRVTWRVTLDDGPGVQGQPDAWGVATHEFGHATGFIGHWNTFDSSLCQNDMQYHTMCQSSVELVSSHWARKRTPEVHDLHTFESWYPRPRGWALCSLAGLPGLPRIDTFSAAHCDIPREHEIAS